jgi:serine/threonine protein kinase
MGTVWAAALVGERGFSKLVAVKTILHELSDEVQYVRALRDEAQLAASIHHPHICDVTELAEAFGYPFLVMEWVDGASLAELLGGFSEPPRWQPLDPLVASQIAADACAGLHALHEARDSAGLLLGAVHRDVSPQNVLLSSLGQVKMSDMGVAKARGQLRAKTRSDELRGKLGYLAPEQIARGTPDRRTDVHAVGCVLYLCLSGALPYPAEASSFHLVLAGKYPRLEQLRPELPQELIQIVAKALETEPAARFQTALALREALEGWRAQHTHEHGQRHIAECLRERLGPGIRSRNERICSAFVQHVQPASPGSLLSN